MAKLQNQPWRKNEGDQMSPIKEKIPRKLKANRVTIIAIILGIVLPWIFMGIFQLTYQPTLSAAVNGNLGLMFSMTVFNSFNVMLELPFLGNGYWICFLIWAVTGFFIGILTRSTKKGLSATLISLLISYILYLIIIPINGPFLPNELIDPLVNPDLYGNTILATPLALLMQITLYSLVLPMIVSFALLGTLINPEPKLYAVSAEAEAKSDEKLGKIQKRVEIAEEEIPDEETAEIQTIYEEILRDKPEVIPEKKQEEVTPFK